MTFIAVLLRSFHLSLPRAFRRRFFIICLSVLFCVLVFLVFSKTRMLTPVPPPRLTPCKRISTSELRRVPTSKHGIPLILHQIYSDARLPEAYEKLIRRCRHINPDFVHVLWTDEDVSKFLVKERPDLRETYYRYDRGVEKADVSRLILLHYFGGVYLDLDVECNQPLIPALDQFNASCIFDRERTEQSLVLWEKTHLWMNSAMMCRRNHPVFKFLLTMLPLFIHNDKVVYRTGPLFISKVMPIFVAYASQNDSVYLAPSSAFSPFADIPSADLNRLCFYAKIFRYPKFIVKGCKTLTNDPLKRRTAILVHRFLHLGYRRNTGSFDVCAMKPAIVRHRATKRLGHTNQSFSVKLQRLTVIPKS